MLYQTEELSGNQEQVWAWVDHREAMLVGFGESGVAGVLLATRCTSLPSEAFGIGLDGVTPKTRRRRFGRADADSTDDSSSLGAVQQEFASARFLLLLYGGIFLCRGLYSGSFAFGSREL